MTIKIKTNLTTLNTSNKLTRQQKFKKRYEMYNDNFFDQIITNLNRIYERIVELKLDVQINDNNNLYKRVVNTISNVYSFGIKRLFDDPKVQELYTTLQIDKTMTQANRYVNAFNDLILQVSWDEDKKIPDIILRLPHNSEVEYNNGKVESVSYFLEYVGDDKKTERWAYWSKDEHYYIDKNIGGDDKKIANNFENTEDAPNFSNKLGELPFVFMHNGYRDESFWDKYTGDDLTGGTLDMAVHLTFLNHIIKTQSFKQLVGRGDNINGLSGQISDPLSILTMTGQDSEITVLDMQSNYEALNDVIQNLSNNIAISYNISPSQFRMTSQVSSGFALQMENLKLDQFTVEQQQDFKIYEKELFRLLQLVSTVYNNPIPSKDVLIDFVEPNYPVSQQEQIAIAKEKIELGLTSPAKILQILNPDLDDKAAKIEISDNIKARNDMLNKVSQDGSLTDTIKDLGIE